MPPEKKEEEIKKPDVVQVPVEVLTKIQEDLARLEREGVEKDGRIAAMEEAQAATAPVGEGKIRQKKTFEPKFRVVRLRKYPKAGGDPQYIVGWTNKGAYQEVDRTGVSPQMVDWIEVIFLGDEKTAEGKIKAEKVRLLDLLNKGEQVHCKVLDTKRQEIPVPTGEEISVNVWDPQHGLVDTGEKVDGFVAYSEIKLSLQVPGVTEVVTVDAEFVN